MSNCDCPDCAPSKEVQAFARGVIEEMEEKAKGIESSAFFGDELKAMLKRLYRDAIDLIKSEAGLKETS